MQQDPNKNIRVFIVGDFCSKPTTSYITPSEEFKELMKTFDCSVVNFEVPLKPDKQFPPRARERFFQNDDAPDFLRNLGFDLFSMANNHVFDWGEEGYYKTKAALGDACFGSGTYDEAYRVKEVEIKGKKIGFLALSYPTYSWPVQDNREREGLGCAYINDLKVNHIIIEAKKHLDYLFVLPHDGIEYIDIPMPETIARYRDFIEYGADGVFGSHPHCPQGWEEYKGKPIFYSLGNFFFNSKQDTLYRATNRKHWYEGRGVILSITDDGLAWNVVNLKNIDNIAIEIDHSEAAQKHNELVCEYLKDRQKYDSLLQPWIENGVKKDILGMYDMFRPKTVRDAFRVLMQNIQNMIRGKKKQSKSQHLVLFRNDIVRSRMLRFLLDERNWDKY